jgi:hypothetical protein
MFKDKWLAIKANPKVAVAYAVLTALLISGLVSVVQGAKETARLEAERIAVQAQEVENARLAAIKAEEEEKARLAAEEAARLAAIEAEKKAAEEKRIADEKAAAEAKAIADAKAAADATAKAKAAAVAAKPAQDGYCFVFPAYIRPYLSSGSLPDSATVNGHKHVCNKLDDNGKDKPSKNASEENKKGHGGGACYDWDETPNIKACYPVKVYGSLLNNFLKNNPPESVSHGLKFKKP